MSVGGGSNCGGHPYISFLFRMNFFISCVNQGVSMLSKHPPEVCCWGGGGGGGGGNRLAK